MRREHFIEEFEHFVPKFDLLVFQMSCNECSCALWIDIAIWFKMAISSAVRNGMSIHIDVGCGFIELFRMENVEKRQGIVERRVLQFMNNNVEFLIVHDHMMDSLSKRYIFEISELLVNLFVAQILMSHLQRNHHQSCIALQSKNTIEGMRIEEDIEFRSWSYIAFFDSSSHHDDFFKFVLDIRICKQHDAEIGQ